MFKRRSWDTRDVRFSRITIAHNYTADNPVSAVIELLGRDHMAEQHRRKLITIGHMERDGLMMRFVPADKIWIVDFGWVDNPLTFFRDHRVSPTMQGSRDFCMGMLAHLKIMESR